MTQLANDCERDAFVADQASALHQGERQLGGAGVGGGDQYSRGLEGGDLARAYLRVGFGAGDRGDDVRAVRRRARKRGCDFAGRIEALPGFKAPLDLLAMADATLLR